MESLKTLVLVLTPMFISFAIRLPKPYLKMLDRLLVGLVYVILLLIGIGLAQVSRLFSRLDDIALLFALLMVCNLAMLCAFDGLFPWQQRTQAAHGTHRVDMRRYQAGGDGGAGRGNRQAVAACAAATRFCGNGCVDAVDFCGGGAAARGGHCAAPRVAQQARLTNGVGVYALLRGFRLPICLDAA